MHLKHLEHLEHPKHLMLPEVMLIEMMLMPGTKSTLHSF